MIRISDFTPLKFPPIADEMQSISANYIQRWHTTDLIRIQVFGTDGDVPTAILKDLSGQSQSAITLSATEISGFGYVYNGSVTALAEGIYSVEITNGTTSEKTECLPFHVTHSDALLDGTELVAYTHTTDIHPFLAKFIINDAPMVFFWRIYAGFKPNGWQGKVNDESFRSQVQEVSHLFSAPYSVWQLTLGGGCGVPYYVADFLNKVLCLNKVNFGEVEIRRSEAEVPQLTETFANSQSFIVKQNVEIIDSDRAALVRLLEYNNDYNNDYTI